MAENENPQAHDKIEKKHGAVISVDCVLLRTYCDRTCNLLRVTLHKTVKECELTF